jgi:GPI-anchor transamidase subunit GAA1
MLVNANWEYRVNDKLEEFFRASGLKVARQRYKYKSSGQTYTGENIYAILHAPRGDATEAIVLVGGWRNMDDQLNRSGIALILTLARYFKRKAPPSILSQTNTEQAGPFGRRI